MFKAVMYEVCNIHDYGEAKTMVPKFLTVRKVPIHANIPIKPEKQGDNCRDYFLKSKCLLFEKLSFLNCYFQFSNISFMTYWVISKSFWFLFQYTNSEKIQLYVTSWLLILLNGSHYPKAGNHHPAEIVKYQSVATRNYIHNVAQIITIFLIVYGFGFS